MYPIDFAYLLMTSKNGGAFRLDSVLVVNFNASRNTLSTISFISSLK